MAKIIELEQTCTACPTQFEGKLDDGRELYFRARHDVWALYLGRGLNTDNEVIDGKWSGVDDTGGWMNPEVVQALIRDTIEKGLCPHCKQKIE